MLIFYLSLIDDVADQTEFEKLYYKFIGDTMRLVKSIVKNRHDAEDICQEVWFYISQSITHIRSDQDSVKKAYIMKIARHKSYDFLRDKGRMNKYIETVDADEAEALQDMTDAALATVCRKETSETIHQCLNSLDESLREIFIFYYLDNMKVEEIAKLMKIETITVYKRLEAGRSVLVKLLVEKGVNKYERE